MAGSNVGPEFPRWRDAVSTGREAVCALSLRMPVCLAFELGLDAAALRAQRDCPAIQPRLLRWAPNDLPRPPACVGVGSHSDFECFAILHGGRGPRVMSARDPWVEAPPTAGAWSSGRWGQTRPRAPNQGTERLSWPPVFGPNCNAAAPPPETFRPPRR